VRAAIAKKLLDTPSPSHFSSARRPIAIVVMGVLLSSSFIPWLILPANAQAADQRLTVITQDSGGSQINGYYTTLMQSGNFIAAGFFSGNLFPCI
jgi:hypothetical protein